MRRPAWLLLVALLAILAVGSRPPAQARAAQLQYSNPMRDGRTGKPLSCPDPSVIKASRGRWNYFLFCTSDNARNAFPIWMSADLVHWYPDGFVFPAHHQPRWAVPSTGTSRLGLYWAPSIYRIQNRWVLYFATIYNPASGAIGSATLKPHTMVLGVASSSSLAGPWHAELLHYPGQLNASSSSPNQERVGGDIDPGVVRDPRTGKLSIFWAEQREQIWESELSPNGLTMGPDIRLALSVSEPWECDPDDAECTIEGPQPFYHDGRFYVLYSGASTWDSTYSVGVASSSAVLDPTQPFEKLAKPILRAGNGFLGPGGESAPVIGPHGQQMILYHALTHPIAHHTSGLRELMLGQLNWIDGWPLVNDGIAR
ncbi:MAG: glycoside hydrolase family 43 protein [Solirubrobacteraceae bacterium]